MGNKLGNLLPDGWESDGGDPASIASHGGGITLIESVPVDSAAGAVYTPDLYLLNTGGGLSLIDEDGNASAVLHPQGGEVVDVITSGGLLNTNGGNIDAGSGDISTNGGTIGSSNFTAGPQGIFMADLPTADPHQAGQLWNSSGTLKVSAG